MLLERDKRKKACRVRENKNETGSEKYRQR